MTMNILDPAINLQHPDAPAPELRAEGAAPADRSATTADAAKKWAGKYDSPEALEQGYRNSAEETQRILARERVKDQELAALRLQVTGRANPADAAGARKSYVDELTEAMVPTDALGAFVREQIAEAFAPVIRSAQAREAVTKQYSEFSGLEANLNEYLSANPDINERYQAVLADKPDIAMEWLLLRYQRANPAPPPDLSGQDVATARAVGALSSSATGPRGVTTQSEKYAAANDIADRTGNIEPSLRALVESGFITHPDLK